MSLKSSPERDKGGKVYSGDNHKPLSETDTAFGQTQSVKNRHLSQTGISSQGLVSHDGGSMVRVNLKTQRRDTGNRYSSHNLMKKNKIEFKILQMNLN